MKRKPNSSVAAAKLRHRAETRLRDQRKKPSVKIQIPESATDARRLFHELQVHQVELELQNAELRQARDNLEVALENYTDLYDFAPVGYFTFNESGVVLQANLTGANLVGIERSRLLGQPFARLVAAGLSPVFHSFLKRVFADSAKKSCDIELLSPPHRFVNLEAQRLLSGRECRAAVVDITERKRTEDVVRLSEIRYRRLFEAAHDGVVILDPGTRKITDANPFMTKLLGYSHDQLVGKELFQIGLLKDEVASQEMFQKLKQLHEVRYENLPLESREGRHQDVEVVANLYSENGHPVIQCNIRDITERKLAQTALNRLASIVEFSDDAMIGKTPAGIITSWNAGAEKIFGYSAREMVGTSIMRLIPPVGRAEEKYILDKIGRGQSVRHMETLRQTKAGRLINVSVTASPIKDAAGRVIGVSKVARDITERKQAEQVLRRNEALFSSLVAQAPVGVYVVDARFRLQQINPTALPVFKNVHPLLGRDFAEIIHVVWPKRVADQVVARFRHTLKTGVPYSSSEFAQQRRDTGESEIYEWQVQRVTQPRGEHAVVCFFTNITRRKQAEAAQRRIEVLSASNRKLASEIIRRRLVEDSLKRSERDQRLLLAQSRRMQDRLRDLSRQVLRAQEEERQRISRELHDVIAQTLTGINVQLTALAREAAVNPGDLGRSIARTQHMVEKSVDIVHDFARELRPTVLDDLGLIPALHAYVKLFSQRTRIPVHMKAVAGVEQLDINQRTALFRVAQEALTNVARHAAAGRVEVCLLKLAHRFVLKIKDDGKSFQVNPALRGPGGKRLGLLGMRERMEMIGGTFEIESAPGRGTTIQVEIPVGLERSAPLKKSGPAKP